MKQRQKEKTEESAAKNAVPPSADGAYSPVKRVWKAGPVSSANPPKAAPDAGVNPPDQRHKPALFHALYGLAEKLFVKGILMQTHKIYSDSLGVKIKPI